MRGRLITRSGELSGLEFEIGHGGATLGRAAGNDVTLPAKPISGEHARIRFDEDSDAFFLEDLGSTNGTELDGVPVSGEERLGALHVITLAREFDLVFQTLEGEAQESRAPTTEMRSMSGTVVDSEVPVVPDALREGAEPMPDIEGTRVEQLPVILPAALAEAADPAGTGAVVCALEVVGPEALRKIYLLTEGEHRVGRLKTAEVSINGPDLSREHCRITIQGKKIEVEDLGSRNHTYVDGEEITAPAEVRIGSRLRFASVEARLIAPEDVGSPAAES